MKAAHFLVIAALATAVVSIASAQSDVAAAEETGDRVLDTVTITGGAHPGYGKAMAAFEAGDFATAEKEFMNLFDLIGRVETRKEMAFDEARTQAVQQEASSAFRVSSAPGQAPPGGQSAVSTGSDYAGTRRNEDVSPLGTKDQGISLYMAGLSEIQLGEYAKAKESLYRSLTFTRRIADVRLRLGILELRDGQPDKARKQLTALKKWDAECKSACSDAADISESLAILNLGLEQYERGELTF